MVRRVTLTAKDMDRLRDLLETAKPDSASSSILGDELAEAEIVPAEQIPNDVVTMRSRVRVRDLRSGEELAFSIVYPFEADASQNRISILAPLGAAMIGYHVGDTIEWPVPAGTRLLRIEEILYQPEAEGRFDL